MTTAKEILALIESADPEDTAKLDEIDAFVNLYAACIPSVRLAMVGYEAKWLYTRLKHQDYPKYSRSRDALKAIRPDGWHSYATLEDLREGSPFCGLAFNVSSGGASLSKPLPTEELAELHAIIQAIEYERQKKDA